MNKHIM